MNRAIEGFLLPLFFVMSIVYAFNSLCGDSSELKKVFHHTTSDEVYLERGNLCFYFSTDPQVVKIEKQSGNMEKVSYESFFFPNVIISNDECRLMIQRINNYHDCYSIKIESINQPQKGIMVTFGCDTDKLALSYELCDSIGLQKAVVFRLYNKDFINQLQKKDQPLLRTLWHTGKPCIAIDPGHGGWDSGAQGVGGIKEKNICLAIGLNVAQLLEEHGFSVVLTRDNDRNLLLDERTLCANKNHVDFLVSIHANYSFNTQAAGVETFCLQSSLFRKQFSQLSESENSSVTRVMNNKIDYSYQLAQSIQSHICKSIASDFITPIDRKVKFSMAQVLLGAQMPSALVEVGFLSHDKESQLLNSDKYHKTLARGIFNGIVSVVSLGKVL